MHQIQALFFLLRQFAVVAIWVTTTTTYPIVGETESLGQTAHLHAAEVLRSGKLGLQLGHLNGGEGNARSSIQCLALLFAAGSRSGSVAAVGRR